MPPDVISFGDVIELAGREFVFLVSTIDTVYLAIIPDREMSANLRRRRNFVYADPRRVASEKHKTMWCFVELTTEEFKERVAFYGMRDSDCSIEDLAAAARIGTLNAADKKELHGEIVKDDAVTRELQEKVSKIVF